MKSSTPEKDDGRALAVVHISEADLAQDVAGILWCSREGVIAGNAKPQPLRQEWH